MKVVVIELWFYGFSLIVSLVRLSVFPALCTRSRGGGYGTANCPILRIAALLITSAPTQPIASQQEQTFVLYNETHGGKGS